MIGRDAGLHPEWRAAGAVVVICMTSGGLLDRD